jgi:predicted nucleotidyltransferase
MNSNTLNSTLRTPLTDILGSKSHIRIIRVLSLRGGAVSPTKLIKRTGLSKQGVYNGIDRLEKLGVLNYVGSGKQVELRKEYPLYDILVQTITSEQKYFSQLIKDLKKVIEDLKLKPKSAWIYGSVASGNEEYGDPIKIALLGDLKSVDAMASDLRQSIFSSKIEKRFDVTIEVKGVTQAEVDSLRAKDKILLWGTDPSYFLNYNDNESGERTHQEIDRQSLQDADIWVELLKNHPEIIDRTKSYLEEKISSNTSGVSNELNEWYRLLESTSMQRLKKFMQSDSERSTRLRQSLPFWPVLTEAERVELKSEMRNK